MCSFSWNMVDSGCKWHKSHGQVQIAWADMSRRKQAQAGMKDNCQMIELATIQFMNSTDFTPCRYILSLLVHGAEYRKYEIKRETHTDVRF